MIQTVRRLVKVIGAKKPLETNGHEYFSSDMHQLHSVIFISLIPKYVSSARHSRQVCMNIFVLMNNSVVDLINRLFFGKSNQIEGDKSFIDLLYWVVLTWRKSLISKKWEENRVSICSKYNWQLSNDRIRKIIWTWSVSLDSIPLRLFTLKFFLSVF